MQDHLQVPAQDGSRDNPSYLKSPKMSKNRGSSFESVDIDHGTEEEQPDIQPNIEEGCLEKSQFYILRAVEHIGVQIFSVVLILVDVAITIAAIANTDPTFDHNTKIMSNVFLGYFAVEICLRFIGIGPKQFIRNIWEMLDAFIILVSVIMAMVVTDPEASELSRLSVAGRIFRMFRLVRIIPQCRRCVLSMRLTTSENKRRYREDGFDLDLTYITDNIIAMSFPSSGYLALYRNPIEEVSKYFKTRHPGHFKIYNLCSERDFDHSKFEYSVSRFMIDDHNVATLYQMMDFVKDAQKFLRKDPENVIAVHCKGGKGRTGSMICAFLLYSERSTYSNGEKAREYFASRRSDLRVSKKYQGVQTPSQCRFIDYFQDIIHQYDCVIQESPPLFVKSLIITSPPQAIQNPVCDLLVEICDRNAPIISFTLLSATSLCEASYEDDKLTINFHDHVKPCVTGDVKVRFKSKKLPIKYDKASFYFWFNTMFVKDCELHIKRDMLDNPHFTKYNNVYDENFAVTVIFDRKQQQRLV